MALDRQGRDVPTGDMAPEPVTQQAFTALVNVAKQLLKPLDLASVLDEILTQVQRLFGYTICAVLLPTSDGRHLYIAAHRGYDPDVVSRARFPFGGHQGIVGRVSATGQSYYAPDVSADPYYIPGAPGVRSEFAVPLVLDGQVLGILDVESHELDAFPREVQEVIEAFAVLAALAIYRAQRHEELQQLALTDGLTGLANNRAFWENLHRELARAQRFAQPLSLMVLEIDNFKRVNDVYGHLRGDDALRAVARTINVSCRAMDIGARVGGDEFAVILPQTTKAEAVSVAQRLCSQVEALRLRDDIRLTISIGLAAYPEDGTSPNALFAAADYAMYRIKYQGGGGYCVAGAACGGAPASP
ncbi:MAG: sensor domain-containing diguanylate cyclase [Limnochordales bacterium]|nr:sensor domain-containing diguanylate cyclase [Limnochordales bacterium]